MMIATIIPEQIDHSRFWIPWVS